MTSILTVAPDASVAESRLPRVLYAEDEEPVARLVRSRLAAQGIELVWARDGEEALKLVEQDDYDVVALDYRMPRYDGLEVLRRMRARGITLPTVMISGMGSLDVAVEAVRLGAVDYVVKDPQGAYLDLLPTTVQRLVEQLRLRREKERADAARTRLMAALAHDLHQPLVALRLQLEDLGSQLANTLQRERVGHMLQFVRVGETMLEQITEQAALESGRIVPHPRPVELGQLIEEVRREFQPVADVKELMIRTAAQGPATVETDRSLLHRLLSNLVANAIRYTDAGGLLIALRRGGPAWRVEVWDTGAGIPAEELPRIFDDFYRGGGREHGGGVGLGLATVRQIAGLLGLSIGVRSRVGSGSVFSVTATRPGAA
jgi:signal transduction histidine kinase